MDVEKLFNDLESNMEYEDTKNKLTEFFSQTKEQWLVQGMLDYYLTTSSARIIEVLVKVQSPHDTYIFDRLSDWLKGHNRIPSLNVFGFIVQRHPTWLYKVAKHRLMKDILKLLQSEKEIYPLMSALLSVIALLPIIPSLVPNFLPDLFEVFGHLASWNCQNPNKLNESQLIHLQIGLYMLFHRLYGMYPCNFICYLREFKDKEKGAIFHHTIRPLLETVRMHPLLVTATKESEVNSIRWKEMEPHDVVVECAKLSLDYYQDNSECFASVLRSQESYTDEVPVSVQLQTSFRDTQFQPAIGFSSSLHSFLYKELTDCQNASVIWSPSIDILATPPPAGTVPHTPTPSYSVPVITNSGNVLGATGASPPEAAVEATPETTPMKDVSLKRTVAVNSPAIRAILPSSQPSSPMRKEQSPFNFPETSSHIFTTYNIEQTTKITTSQRRLIQIINERNQTPKTLGQLSLAECSNQMLENSQAFGKSGFVSSLDSPTNYTESTQEDQDITELTSQQIGPRHSDTLQDISNEYDDGDETERSPCSVGGLHIPSNKSMQMLAQHIRRNRMASYCYSEASSYPSYGINPADVTNAGNYVSMLKKPKMRRVNSWHAIERRGSIEENSIELDNNLESRHHEITQQNGDSSSPSGDDAISAATHFKKLQLKKERKLCQRPIQEFNSRNRYQNTETQTIQKWPQMPYEPLELFTEDNKLRKASEGNILQPSKILEEYIERTIKMKSSVDSRNREENLKDQLKLLHLQLQFERYRREVHSERNRRLLGKSRELRSLQMDNDRLKDQLNKLQDELHKLTQQIDHSRRLYNHKENDWIQQIDTWKSKYHAELEDNKKLRSTIEILQRRLNEEMKTRRETNQEIEVLRGEIFNLRNDMQLAQSQADLGTQYKLELTKLESEFLVMGEVQLRCRDKLTELDKQKVKEDEIAHTQEVYSEEIKELRSILETKSAQLEAAKHRLSEVLSQLSNKEFMFTDQKRLLKSVKEEYEEKFRALNNKYEVQKAIILSMEQSIFELYKKPSSASLSTISSESDKTDIAGSVDHTSPLSISLASSEGLSASLRSFPELRNLQALVAQPNTASGHTITLTTTATLPTTHTLVTSSASSVQSLPLQQQHHHHQHHHHQQQQQKQTSSVAGTSSRRTSSSNQHSSYYSSQQTTVKGSKVTSVSSSPQITAAVTIPSTSSSSSTLVSSPSTRTRHSATSLDIPVPGPSQHHSNLRHHR